MANTLTMQSYATHKFEIILMVSLLLLAMLSGCTSNIPLQIKQETTTNISPAEARQQPDIFSQQIVRWGGEIISIENKPEYSQMTLLAQPLNSNGNPETNTRNYGRIIAQVNRFLEPSLYSPGREITIYGRFTGNVARMIGEYRYQHPLVLADIVYLWPIPIDRDIYYEPDYWYDPWYPWYPWGGLYHYPHSHNHVKSGKPKK